VSYTIGTNGVVLYLVQKKPNENENLSCSYTTHF